MCLLMICILLIKLSNKIKMWKIDLNLLVTYFIASFFYTRCFDNKIEFSVVRRIVINIFCSSYYYFLFFFFIDENIWWQEAQKLSREFPSNYSTRVGKCSVCVHKIPSRWWRCFNVFALCLLCKCCTHIHLLQHTNTHTFAHWLKGTHTYTEIRIHSQIYTNGLCMPKSLMLCCSFYFIQNVMFWRMERQSVCIYR